MLNRIVLFILQNFAVYCDIGVAMMGHLSMHDLADELERDMYRTKDNNFKVNLI